MRALLLCLTMVAGACARFDPVNFEDQVEMLIAADSIPCVGAHGPRKCLSARDLIGGDVASDPYPLFDGIEGFEHDPRFEYHLLVGRREIPNPPQDGSSIRNRLIQILSRTPID